MPFDLRYHHAVADEDIPRIPQNPAGSLYHGERGNSRSDHILEIHRLGNDSDPVLPPSQPSAAADCSALVWFALPEVYGAHLAAILSNPCLSKLSPYHGIESLSQ